MGDEGQVPVSAIGYEWRLNIKRIHVSISFSKCGVVGQTPAGARRCLHPRLGCLRLKTIVGVRPVGAPVAPTASGDATSEKHHCMHKIWIVSRLALQNVRKIYVYVFDALYKSYGT